MKTIVIVVLTCLSLTTMAQVEHNFEMEPTKTNCHTLPDSLNGATQEKAMALITAATFRFEQEFKISQYQSPQSATYYSCDGKVGYVIAKEKDSQYQIFTMMPKAIWDAFSNAKDPIGYYTSEEFQQYLVGY